MSYFDYNDIVSVYNSLYQLPPISKLLWVPVASRILHQDVTQISHTKFNSSNRMNPEYSRNCCKNHNLIFSLQTLLLQLQKLPAPGEEQQIPNM